MALPIVRTQDEAHLSMDRHSCERRHSVEVAWQSGLTNDEGPPARRYHGICTGCRTAREFVFRLPERPAVPAPTTSSSSGTMSSPSFSTSASGGSSERLRSKVVRRRRLVISARTPSASAPLHSRWLPSARSSSLSRAVPTRCRSRAWYDAQPRSTVDAIGAGRGPRPSYRGGGVCRGGPLMTLFEAR
jgi:hypothetical protein